MAQLDFNAYDVEPDEGFAPLPAGQYQAVVSASEEKKNRNSPGSHLEMSFTVIEGKFANRKIWTSFNLKHPNPEVVRISKAQLSALCRAVGVMNPADSDELHNIPLLITVGHKQRQDGGGLVNTITKYEPVAPAAPTSAPPPAAGPAAPLQSPYDAPTAAAPAYPPPPAPAANVAPATAYGGPSPAAPPSPAPPAYAGTIPAGPAEQPAPWQR